ncbi:PAS domain-containing protein [Maribacter sp. Asnod1-A12]|uniref:PAS domain-containing protein n=1 Tax=Maribacter sp. Asnod1-A12 TaxID=3160576 RepID=UPI00386B1010
MNRDNILSTTEKLSSKTNGSNRLGIFHFEVNSNITFWNNILKEIHEVPNNYIPQIENIYGNLKNENDKKQILLAHNQAITNGISFELEYYILTAKGNTRHVRTSAQAIPKDNKNWAIYGVTVDISKNTDILNKINQLNYAERLAKSGSWEWDLQSDVLKWSDNLYNIFDHSKDEPISFNTYLNYVHKDDSQKIAAKFELALKTNDLSDSISCIQLNNGTIKTISSIGKVITNAKGEAIKMVGTCQDITEKKAEEKVLLQKKRQLQLTENTNEAGSWQWNPDTGIFKWSDNLYKIMDFDYGEPMNFEVLYTRIHPEDIHIVDDAMQFVQDTGTKCNFTHRIIINDGSIRTLEITADMVSNKSNNDKDLIGTTRDITNKIKAKQELTEKNQILNFAEHHTTMGYWRYKPETNEAYWSNNLYKIFDHPKTEKLTFNSYFKRIHPDDQEFIEKSVNQSIKDHNFYDFTHRIVHKNNKVRIVHIVGKASLNEYDGLQEFIGTCLDITDFKAKEYELSKKNLQLNIAEKMAMIGYWQWNTPTNEVFWSDNLHAIYGHDKDASLTFETYINYVHDEDRDTVYANLKGAMESSDFPESVYRIQLDDGSIKTIKSVGKVIKNKKGDVLEMSGTCQDITEFKRKELEILEKNRQLNLAEEIAMLGLWEWKPQKNIFKWSESLYKIYGFEPSSEVNIDRAISMVYPPDKEKVKEVISNLLKGIEQPTSRYRIILDNNEIKTLEVRREITKDKNGDVELLGTTQDITQIVKTEQLLKEKNHLLSFTEEMALMGSWQWNPNSGFSKWSDNLYKLYDLEVGIQIDMELFLTRIHPEDIEKVAKHIDNIISTKNSEGNLSYRILMNDGSIRSLELMAEIVNDSDGNIIELIGTAQDVTDRIQREQDLLEKNQLLNFAEQLSSIGHWKWDIMNDVMEKSVNLLKILDFESGKSLNFNKYLKRVHPDDKEKVIRVSQEILKTKKFNKFQHRIIKNDGRIRTIEIIGAVLLNDAGNVVELIGSSQDITEQVEAQQKILETNKSLEAFTKTLTSKNKQLAEFNHITSHNLRSPVSNLNALLDLYRNATCEAKKVEIFEKFETVIDHLTETLNTLIETITVKESIVKVQHKLSFEKTLDKTKEILAAELIETGAIINCDFSKARNVLYNPVYLESIFLNLVSNSLKYRSPKRVLELCITSRTIDGKTKLEFKDNGLGIDMKSHGHKLFGLNKVFHKHPEAKGIGLFLTKAQLVSMGGSITAKSEVNVGTTFYITLN